ncbi:hypothetical protein L4D76_13605 [Photobacterium sagamiensis]|uniref:hypothetical protein n=1 Tax=Photobacterium sagamiensis TaxID=2910241 RepID=UPI003D152CC7
MNVFNQTAIKAINDYLNQYDKVCSLYKTDVHKIVGTDHDESESFSIFCSLISGEVIDDGYETIYILPPQRDDNRFVVHGLSQIYTANNVATHNNRARERSIELLIEKRYTKEGIVWLSPHMQALIKLVPSFYTIENRSLSFPYGNELQNITKLLQVIEEQILSQYHDDRMDVDVFESDLESLKNASEVFDEIYDDICEEFRELEYLDNALPTSIALSAEAEALKSIVEEIKGGIKWMWGQQVVWSKMRKTNKLFYW